jgi:hypothetical protein
MAISRVPGPGGKDLPGKNHEAASTSWTRRANPPPPPWKGFSPGRGDWLVARSARPILRKPVKDSEKRTSPADAFCPEGPCPRATTEASWNCHAAAGGPQAAPGFWVKETTMPTPRILFSLAPIRKYNRTMQSAQGRGRKRGKIREEEE